MIIKYNEKTFPENRIKLLTHTHTHTTTHTHTHTHNHQNGREENGKEGRRKEGRKEEGRRNNPHLAFSRRNDPTCLIFSDCLMGV